MCRHTMGRSVLELAELMVLMAKATGPQLAPGLLTSSYFAFAIIIMHIAMMLPSGVASTIMYIAVVRGVRTPNMLEVERSCVTYYHISHLSYPICQIST